MLSKHFQCFQCFQMQRILQRWYLWEFMRVYGSLFALRFDLVLLVLNSRQLLQIGFGRIWRTTNLFGKIFSKISKISHTFSPNSPVSRLHSINNAEWKSNIHISFLHHKIHKAQLKWKVLNCENSSTWVDAFRFCRNIFRIYTKFPQNSPWSMQTQSI